ncbi:MULTISPECIES: ComF family protein [unclassified Paenibacillus]|uniref:ComF family protein n=1 Tax=unclassified Paenibacillus TaxID=185978 RepID=UPI000955B604|nr:MULTISPECIES: ComF family protein [unclassified Paenibacillus]ASS67242.1 ComF family protein [Paenibacillus sp. RUD330]SIQ84506.1 Predicted amidophosphoribosyltransferases [Paenibacillus sp. RU4X]SIR05371.1 Predicted amidophosphoribosyltransferases [Paenibacillus sp. RU4T]
MMAQHNRPVTGTTGSTGPFLPGGEKPPFLFPLLRRLLDLLSPAPARCIMCGKPHRPGAPNSQGIYATTSLPPDAFPRAWQDSLCRPCKAGIPWIRKPACPVCGRPEQCGDCRRRTNGGLLRNRSSVRYDPFMKELLARYKYKGDEALLPLLGAMLLPAYEQLAWDALGMRTGQGRSRPAFDLITYVPVSPERLRERGFNQAERLAHQLGLHASLPVAGLLRRQEERGKMSSKSRSERLQASESLFAASAETNVLLQAAALSRAALPGAPISAVQPLSLLIVDDIYTTGGTLDGCAHALHAASPVPLDIRSLAWARA